MQNISPIFFGANDVVEHYGKIILRTDQTGHGHPTLFDRNWLIGCIGHALLGQLSKGHPYRILILFP
jgi:hypothetical protein